MAGSRNRQLRDRLQKALERERHGEALRIYEALERIEPNEPRWPHRKGDLLKRLGRRDEAVTSYETAVDLYATLGFVARAAAMAKVVLSFDPTRLDVLQKVNLDPARKLHRSARRNIVTAADHGIDEATPVTQTKRISTKALPLVQDDSAPEGELHFTKPPMSAQHGVELEISAAEVGDRPLANSGTPSERPTPQHLALLPSTPLFTEIPRPMLERLVSESRLLDLEDGDYLIEKGTTADALYALVEGTVEFQRAMDEGPVRLSEGDVVGISCLLEHASYGADVTARGRVRAMRISKLLLDRLVAEHAPFGDVLLEVVGRRLVATLVRTSSLFAGLDDEDRSRVARMFEVRKATKGTQILQAGKRSDGLYIPMLGELVATGPDGEELGKLKLGRALAQDSVLTQGLSPVTVEALSDVLVLRMSTARFDRLVSKNPNMIAHLEELARHASEPVFSLVPRAHKKHA